MQWLEFDDTALRYEMCGAGTGVVVLIHELGGTLESWDRVVPALAQRFRVLRYDMRGAGLSAGIDTALTIEMLAHDLGRLLRAVRADQNIVLVGNAVGAAVAAKLLAGDAEGAKGGILISPALGLAADRKAPVLALAATCEREGTRSILEGELEKSYPTVLRQRDEAAFATYRARWLANSPHSLSAYFRMLASLDLHDDVTRIASPVLVLSGSADPLRPPEQGRSIAARIANATCATVKSGHFMAYQTPELFLEKAIPFLGDHLGSSA